MRRAGSRADGTYEGTDTKDYEEAGAQSPTTAKQRILEKMSQVVEYDWQPTCKHGGEPVPAVVLDPFGGAGTTALVANQHGRDAILCELNPEYAAIARDRVNGVIVTPGVAEVSVD